MSRFKTGDVVIGPMLGRRWVFLAEFDGRTYLLPEKDEADADATSFIGTLDDGWKLAPKPFFEEGKTYRVSGDHHDDGWRMTIRKVVEVDGIRVALSVSGGHVTPWYEHEFSTLKEAK